MATPFHASGVISPSSSSSCSSLGPKKKSTKLLNITFSLLNCLEPFMKHPIKSNPSNPTGQQKHLTTMKGFWSFLVSQYLEHLKECKKPVWNVLKLGIGTSQHIPTHRKSIPRNIKGTIKKGPSPDAPPTQKKTRSYNCYSSRLPFFWAGISPCDTRGPTIASPVFDPRRSTTMASRSGSASFKAFSTKTLVTMFQMETVKTKMKIMNTAFVFFLFLYRWFFGFKDISRQKLRERQAWKNNGLARNLGLKNKNKKNCVKEF